MNSSSPKVVGIGEILWDVFPDDERLGGAPSNFACHCHQLGGDAYPVSCVGNDDLGQRTRTELQQRGVSSEFIQESETHPTGRVLVTLDAAGKPTYKILEDMAWDYLAFTSAWKSLAESLDAACFGVLSQRSAQSRETIRTFLRHMPEDSLKIFDVNLRKPFFSKELVLESLKLATILKLSDEELPVLAEYFGLTGSVFEQLAALRDRFGLSLVAYTRGREGSILSTANETDETGGVEVTVIDSVGAGDSFTAALCMSLLKGRPLAEVNTFANQVAAYVCSRKGACPKLPERLKSV